MTTAQLAERLKRVERCIEDLQFQLVALETSKRRWWLDEAGRFANDPVFEEMIALGRAYRKSLRPRQRKANRDRS